MAKETVYTPIFKVSIKGKSFTKEDIVLLKQIEVVEEINLPAMCIVTLSLQGFEGEQWKLGSYQLGDPITVSLGINKAAPLFTGEVVAIAPTFGGTNTLEIRAYDKMHRLRMGTYQRTFKKKKDSDIAKSMAGEHSLAVEADATSVKYEHIFQNNISNYEFLLERAKRINYELYHDGNTFFFRKPAVSKAPKITLRYSGENKSDTSWGFTMFEAELKTLTQGSKVEVRGWDMMKKQELKGNATKGKELSKMSAEKIGFELSQKMGKPSTTVMNYRVSSKEEAQALAEAFFNLRLKDAVSGIGDCLGLAAIRAGNTIKISGISTYSGTYYLTGTRHIYDHITGYITRFTVSRVGI